MPTISGDPEQLSALKSTFDQQAAAIQQLIATLRTQLEGTHWQGPSADRFRSVWSGEFEPVLRRLEQALVDAGVEVGAARDRLIQAGS
jgi:WXG100 family type VII secretion target